MKFTLYASDTKGNLSNCLYTRKIEVVDTASFIEAIKFDHVSAKYKDNYRSNANFIKSDNLVLDCDNDHSDDPNDWVTSLNVAMAFSGIPFAIAYSRNHQREKGSKSARPRFHVYFMIPEITDQAEYAYLKQQIASMFPYFDTNAIDSARFIFGTDNAVVEVFEGDKSILGLIDETIFSNWDEEQEEIPEGKRNNTMSHYAGRIIKRFGNTDEAYELFLKQAEKCNPPLEDRELKVIWASAISFGKKISSQEDYIPPDKYNAEFGLKQPEYSDIGQAEVFVREYQDTVRYSTSTKFLVYNGSY